MKILLRILHTFFLLLSVLLFLATAFLWLRSQSHLDQITQYHLKRYICIESVEGRFYYNHWIAPAPFWADEPIKFGGGELARLRYAHIPFSRQLGPFAYGHGTSGPNLTVVAVGDVYMFPHWSILLMAAILPALSMRQIVKKHLLQRRTSRGLCPGCGYDLRSTPTRCPECGLQNASATLTP